MNDWRARWTCTDHLIWLLYNLNIQSTTMIPVGGTVTLWYDKRIKDKLREQSISKR